MSTPPRSRTRRVSAQDWLETGLEALAAEGPEALRIDRLAKKLGVARSGYYWHFASREQFIDALFQYWSHEFTDVVVDNPELLALAPRERLARTAELVDRYELGRYDLPLRTWALRDPAAARTVKRVTRRRLDHFRRALGELGFEGDDLEMRAHVFVVYQTWERSTCRDLSATRRAQLCSIRLDLLLTAPRKSRRPR